MYNLILKYVNLLIFQSFNHKNIITNVNLINIFGYQILYIQCFLAINPNANPMVVGTLLCKRNQEKVESGKEVTQVLCSTPLIASLHHEQVRTTTGFKDVSVPLIFPLNLIFLKLSILCYTWCIVICNCLFLFWEFGSYTYRKLQGKSDFCLLQTFIL